MLKVQCQRYISLADNRAYSHSMWIEWRTSVVDYV